MGFVYRVEHSLLRSLEQVTGCRAEACFITPTELHYQMERLEAAREDREIIVEESMTAAEMAKRRGRIGLGDQGPGMPDCQNARIYCG